MLKSVAHYGLATRAQVERVTGETNGRVVRKHLLTLCQAGFLRSLSLEVINSMSGESPCKVFVATPKGLEFLAAELEHDRWLSRSCHPPSAHLLLHAIKVVDFHILIDAAVRAGGIASVDQFVNEWDVRDAAANEPHKRFGLFELITDKPKRLVCCPDAGFVLCALGHRKVHYVEIDRGTSSAGQIANSKPNGYIAIAERQLHRRRFDVTADSIRVLHVSLTAQRRRIVQNAVAKEKGAELWLFSDFETLTREKSEDFLYGESWTNAAGNAVALVKRAPVDPVADPVAAFDGCGGPRPDPILAGPSTAEAIK